MTQLLSTLALFALPTLIGALVAKPAAEEAVLGVYAWGVGTWARARAARSAGTRTLLLWGAILAIGMRIPLQ